MKVHLGSSALVTLSTLAFTALVGLPAVSRLEPERHVRPVAQVAPGRTVAVDPESLGLPGDVSISGVAVRADGRLEVRYGGGTTGSVVALVARDGDETQPLLRPGDRFPGSRPFEAGGDDASSLAGDPAHGTLFVSDSTTRDSGAVVRVLEADGSRRTIGLSMGLDGEVDLAHLAFGGPSGLLYGATACEVKAVAPTGTDYPRAVAGRPCTPPGLPEGAAPDGTPAFDAPLKILGIATGPSGLHLLTAGEGRMVALRRVTEEGTLATVASVPQRQCEGRDCRTLSALAADPRSGALYAIDEGARRVIRFDGGGRVTPVSDPLTLVGERRSEYGPRFQLAVDPRGGLVVAADYYSDGSNRLTALWRVGPPRS